MVTKLNGTPQERDVRTQASLTTELSQGEQVRRLRPGEPLATDLDNRFRQS